MSYHLSIVRTKGGGDIPIPLEDLRRLADAHPQYQLTMNSDGSANLRAQSAEGEFHVYWTANHLWAERLDQRFINPLVEIANQLGARVRGDESESYRSQDDVYAHPDDGPAVAADEADSAARSRRRVWVNIIRWAVLAVVLALMLREAFLPS